MADDPYKTLGVDPKATDAEIKKAYRKLAKDLHPDLNPGDTTAAERFKKVSAAYDLLRDPEKRAKFDRGEIDATGAETFSHGFYRDHAERQGGDRYYSSAGFEDFADMSDLFSGIFAERRGARGGSRHFEARGQDLHYTLEVDFLDAVNGADRRITLPDGQQLDLKIPAGTRDGSTLRLKGKGAPGLGVGPAGDALVEVAVRPHPLFRRDGDDIEIEVPIAIDEAVLGAKIEVPTVSGRVSVTVPKGSSSGEILRLRGKGVKANGRKAGDQRVRLRVVVPKKPDPELEAFMKTWRESRAGDPREQLRTVR